MKSKNILFIYQDYSGFVKNDFDILSTEFMVTRYRFIPAKGIARIFIQLFRQFVFLLFNIHRFDLIYMWFADTHTLLPVFFAKVAGIRSYLVIGGYDVCRIRELNYGVFCSKMRGFAAIWSMKNSTVNLPVSGHVARKVRALTRQQNFRILYNCVRLQLPEIRDAARRLMVLTVAQIESRRTYLLKGIDTFVETARLLPDIPFCIAGLDQKKLEILVKDFPENVRVIGQVEHQQLADYFLRSKIYCQFSRSESFGIALAEAIWSGCYPLVTQEGGMPEVVGDKRWVVRRNAVEIAGKIEALFHSAPQQVGLSEKFLYPTREKQLIALLQKR